MKADEKGEIIIDNSIPKISPFDILDMNSVQILKWHKRRVKTREISRFLLRYGIEISAPTIRIWLKLQEEKEAEISINDEPEIEVQDTNNDDANTIDVNIEQE